MALSEAAIKVQAALWMPLSITFLNFIYYFLRKQKASKYDLNIFDNLFYKKNHNIKNKTINILKEKNVIQNKNSVNIIPIVNPV